jgi:hypothetical protein
MWQFINNFDEAPTMVISAVKSCFPVSNIRLSHQCIKIIYEQPGVYFYRITERLLFVRVVRMSLV